MLVNTRLKGFGTSRDAWVLKSDAPAFQKNEKISAIYYTFTPPRTSLSRDMLHVLKSLLLDGVYE